MDPHTLVCLDTDRVREGVFGAEDLSDEALAMEHLLSLVTRKLMLGDW
jgi:hypothetical protein